MSATPRADAWRDDFDAAARAHAVRLEAEAERDALRAEKGEAEEWLGEYGAGGTPAGLIGGIHNLAHRAEKAEAQLAAAVERAEKAERRANHHCEEYDLIRAEASRKNEAAVERERELTRAIEAKVPDAPWEFVQDDIDLRLGRARVFTARNHLVCETTPEYADVIVCAVGFMLNAGGGTAAVAEAGDDGR